MNNIEDIVPVDEYLKLGRFILSKFRTQYNGDDIDSIIGLGYTITLNTWYTRTELRKYKFSTLYSNTLIDLWLQELRKNKAKSRSLFQEVGIEKVGEINNNLNLENEVIIKLILHELLSTFTEKKKDICLLFLQGFTIKSIADEHKISTTRVQFIIREFRDKFSIKYLTTVNT